MLRHLRWAAQILMLMLATACGGGGGGGGGGSSLAGNSSSSGSGSTSSSGSPGTSSGNSLTVTVDSGPTSLQQSDIASVNTLYASVTICTPGTTACQSIDHVQVDTGSTGLRIVSSVLTGAASPSALSDPTTGDRLLECVQFADGYTWGSMAVADVQIGSRTISGVPINLIGDSVAGAAPSSCSNGAVSENDVASLGSNGILGVGVYLQDCGAGCAQAPALAGFYYICPGGQCQPTRVSTSNQTQNVVALMTTDNNGVVISLPAVSAPGATTLNGTLFFGVSSQSDNELPGSATLLELDDYGEFTTVFNGKNLSASFIDSGSNGYFFPDNSIGTCPTPDDSFYCPPASLTGLSATLEDSNGHAATASFSVDNAQSDFDNYSSYAAYTGLAGVAPNVTTTGGSSFDWGLPFFYGRPVYVLFESASLSGVTGPATAF